LLFDCKRRELATQPNEQSLTFQNRDAALAGGFFPRYRFPLSSNFAGEETLNALHAVRAQLKSTEA
jgi:hypothetical protein